jgi:hypothetical protein
MEAHTEDSHLKRRGGFWGDVETLKAQQENFKSTLTEWGILG